MMVEILRRNKCLKYFGDISNINVESQRRTPPITITSTQEHQSIAIITLIAEWYHCAQYVRLSMLSTDNAVSTSEAL